MSFTVCYGILWEPVLSQTETAVSRLDIDYATPGVIRQRSHLELHLQRDICAHMLTLRHGS